MMNQTKLLTLTFLCLTFFNCNKEETQNKEEISEKMPEEPSEPVSEIYFTLKTDCNEDTSERDNWIILHRENGELLDYKSYEAGDILTFEATIDGIPEFFTVTEMDVYEFQGFPFHIILSDTHIPKNSVRDLTCSPLEEIPENPVIGNFSLQVSNIPFQPVSNNFLLSNGFGVNMINQLEPNSPGLTDFIDTIDIQEKGKDYLISIFDRNFDYKYYVIENFNDGDNISINYDQFGPYDSYLEIDIPDNDKFIFLLNGMDDNARSSYQLSFINTSWIYSDPLNFVRIGYLDRFETYQTFLSIRVDETYEYTYRKNGAKPDAIIIPKKPSIVVENESIQSFKFSTELEGYLFKSSSWGRLSDDSRNDFTQTVWRVTSLEGYSPTIGRLPEEIILLYPEIYIEDIKYAGTLFELNEEEQMVISE